MSNTDRPDRPEPVPAPSAVSSSDQVSIRRSPKFGVFIVGGGLLGLVVTVIVVAATQNIDRTNSTAVTGTTVTDAGFWGTVGYFSLWGITAGMVLGALVAIILDRVFARRAAQLTAERVDVAAPIETLDGETLDDETLNGEIDDEDGRRV